MSEQISFDELEFEGAYEEERTTISGNEYHEVKKKKKITINDLAVDAIIKTSCIG